MNDEKEKAPEQEQNVEQLRQQIDELEIRVELAEKLESLGVLSAGIAHDFNNLLTGILGNSDLALRKMDPSSPALGHVKSIEASAERAANLVKQMLAYTGQGKFTFETTNLSTIIRDMTGLLEASLSEIAVLECDLAANLPVVEVDPSQIRHIITNLIANSSEALVEDHGIIFVNTGVMECDINYLSQMSFNDDLPVGYYTYLEVADTGCGMDSETTDRIFDPFFTTKHQGRGLGLASVLGIVRGHNGAIKVYSEPGQGTTIRVLFPSTDKPLALASAPTPAAEDEGWQGSGTILLVDDDESVRDVGSNMLELLGFEVMTASDGREGVNTFRDNSDEITLVLLDMTMPHLSGQKAFEEIKKIRNNAIVILTSGYTEELATHRFPEHGLAGFIQKPYVMNDLRTTLKEILG